MLEPEVIQLEFSGAGLREPSPAQTTQAIRAIFTGQYTITKTALGAKNLKIH